MPIFLDYADWDLVLEHFAQKLGLDLLEVLSGQKKLPTERLSLSSWQTINTDLTPSEDLFGEPETKITLVDIDNLSLKKVDEKFLQGLSLDAEVYFLRSAGNGFNAEEKKIWKSLKFEYVTLKKFEDSTKQSLLEKYLNKHELNLNATQKSTLIKQTGNYTELLNVLDQVNLTDQPEKVLKNYFAEEVLPIFMLPFSLNKLESNTRTWASRIGEDEVQLGLSLIYGKLDKQSGGQARELQTELIQTDKRIKTNNRANPHTWWKLFLWRAGRL
jgi:hypothetical protein